MRRSVIVFGIAQTVTYLRFLNGGKTSIGLVSTLVLQEIWFQYSFISCTVLCMRAFIRAFSTPKLNVGGALNTSSGIALTSMKRSRTGRDPNTSVVPIPGASNFRPDVAMYDVDVTNGRKRRTADGDSITSDDSQQMIIRRETHIQVQ